MDNGPLIGDKVSKRASLATRAAKVPDERTGILRAFLSKPGGYLSGLVVVLFLIPYCPVAIGEHDSLVGRLQLYKVVLLCYAVLCTLWR